jgi:hypothetical protein
MPVFTMALGSDNTDVEDHQLDSSLWWLRIDVLFPLPSSRSAKILTSVMCTTNSLIAKEALGGIIYQILPRDESVILRAGIDAYANT